MQNSENLPSRNLMVGVAAFATSLIAHNANHARLGIAASPEAVVWAGTLVLMLSAVMVTLAVAGHALAPQFCAVGGVVIALGVAASHLLPKWGPLSDPILTEPASFVTRLAVFGEIAGAAFLAYMALRAIRTQRTSNKLA